MSFHPEILSDPQIEALRTIALAAESEGFYLAGGTALAIRFGHRQSIDFDWFRGEGFDPLLLRGRIPGIEVTQTGGDTLHGSVKDIGHVLVALTYFDDAEREPIPRMLVDTDWETVKSTLRERVRTTAN